MTAQGSIVKITALDFRCRSSEKYYLQIHLADSRLHLDQQQVLLHEKNTQILTQLMQSQSANNTQTITFVHLLVDTSSFLDKQTSIFICFHCGGMCWAVNHVQRRWRGKEQTPTAVNSCLPGECTFALGKINT